MAKIVHDYRRNHAPSAGAELDFYAALPTLREAVARASRAERPDGKRHDHQTRIRREVLAEVARRLDPTRLRHCRSFDALYSSVEAEIRSIHGVGELLVYDTSLRIGAKLNLEPELVYLHAGTLDGARALGFGKHHSTLDPNLLPRALRSLRPREIEDCLCIYKEYLRNVSI